MKGINTIKAYTIRPHMLWCFLMLVNMTGLIVKGPHNAVHTWIAVGCGIVMISPFFTSVYLKKTLIPECLFLIITGLTGTIQHFKLGITLSPPMTFAGCGLLVLILKFRTNHSNSTQNFTFKKKRNHEKKNSA